MLTVAIAVCGAFRTETLFNFAPYIISKSLLYIFSNEEIGRWGDGEMGNVVRW
ncbi:MAG: hypothetical protein F6K18_07990 [Okeania sp. SIO2C2]|uniref:hypothetical protein n=1 Tax=Okeania sp. SIO2C2 TaxID=2607787 RepID=UPI0013BBF7F2|nr:hypothetical protein [Okeania sp. SIO2C2]NEP86778.1 hypothetical protein [Okeania sp. SIO2C2]